MESTNFLVGPLKCFTDIFNRGRMWVDSMSLYDIGSLPLCIIFLGQICNALTLEIWTAMYFPLFVSWQLHNYCGSQWLSKLGMLVNSNIISLPLDQWDQWQLNVIMGLGELILSARLLLPGSLFLWQISQVYLYLSVCLLVSGFQKVWDQDLNHFVHASLWLSQGDKLNELAQACIWYVFEYFLYFNLQLECILSISCILVLWCAASCNFSATTH